MPTETVKELEEGRVRREETLQVRLVGDEIRIRHGWLSMVMEGVAKDKYWPVRVRLYPPNTAPLILDSALTTGVRSYLYYTAELKTKLLAPSS